MDWLVPFKGAYGIQRRTKAVMNNTPVNTARNWNTASTYTAANNPTTAKGTVIFNNLGHVIRPLGGSSR
ncbi:hypothetical protein N9N11_01235 [Candidatus Poseidoniales archaeon]|nr:hypothetical protein [Candidatus Poseidoniales archaeon]